jgi:hypothetical protein
MERLLKIWSILCAPKAGVNYYILLSARYSKPSHLCGWAQFSTITHVHSHLHRSNRIRSHSATLLSWHRTALSKMRRLKAWKWELRNPKVRPKMDQDDQDDQVIYLWIAAVAHVHSRCPMDSRTVHVHGHRWTASSVHVQSLEPLPLIQRSQQSQKRWEL